MKNRDWTTRRIGELGHVVTGKTPPTKDYENFEGPYPFITIPDLDSRVTIDRTQRTLSEKGADKVKSSLLPAGAVLMSCIATVGKCGITSKPSFTNQQINSVIPGPEIDSMFLYYAFTQLAHQLDSAGGGGSVYTNVSKSRFSNIEITFPALPEQRAIAHILGALDDKIELNRRMNETLEEMARALFKSWFVDFEPVRAKMEGRWRRGESLPGMPAELYDVFPDGMVDSELGEIPARWGVAALGDLIELAYGKALKADNRRSGTIPVYGSNGQVGWHDEKLVAGPGIVVGRKGNPGVVTWVHADFFPIDTTFYVVPRVRNWGLPFLFFALTTQDLPAISADSAVPGLNRNLAYMNKQVVPSGLILDEFNDCAGAIFRSCHLLKKESSTLAAQRDALLPRLVSGEIGVGIR